MIQQISMTANTHLQIPQIYFYIYIYCQFEEMHGIF